MEMENISKNTKSRKAKCLCRIWADLFRHFPGFYQPVEYSFVKILLFARTMKKPEGTVKELEAEVWLTTLYKICCTFLSVPIQHQPVRKTFSCFISSGRFRLSQLSALWCLPCFSCQLYHNSP